MDFPAKGYKDLKENCPDVPADTCPLIDKTLKHVTEIEVNLEQLRDQNEALRDVGKFWRATALNLLQECCDLNKCIKLIKISSDCFLFINIRVYHINNIN